MSSGQVTCRMRNNLIVLLLETDEIKSSGITSEKQCSYIKIVNTNFGNGALSVPDSHMNVKRAVQCRLCHDN